MLSLFSALSKFVVTITPFVLLPLSLVLGVNTTLKISITFLVYHLLVAAIRYYSKGLWDSISVFTEIPLLGLVGCGMFYLPDSLAILYKYGLDWSGPALVVVEGIQIARLISMSGKRVLVTIGDHPDYLTFFKIVVIGGSLVCYIAGAYIAYNIFTSPSINIPFASFVSSAITLLLVLNVASIFIDGAVLSDAAMLFVYVLLCCRFALLQLNNISTMEKSAQGGWLSSLSGFFSVNVTRVFTSDYVLAILLSGLALFTLAFPVEILDDEDIGHREPEKKAIWEIVKEAIFKLLAIALYTHLILELSGSIFTYLTHFKSIFLNFV